MSEAIVRSVVLDRRCGDTLLFRVVFDDGSSGGLELAVCEFAPGVFAYYAGTLVGCDDERLLEGLAVAVAREGACVGMSLYGVWWTASAPVVCPPLNDVALDAARLDCGDVVVPVVIGQGCVGVHFGRFVEIRGACMVGHGMSVSWPDPAV